MRDQSHLFRGSQNFCFSVFFLERSNSLYVLSKQMKPIVSLEVFDYICTSK